MDSCVHRSGDLVANADPVAKRATTPLRGHRPNHGSRTCGVVLHTDMKQEKC